MRLTSLVLVLALGCATPGAELAQEPSAPVAAAPAAAGSAATAQPEEDDFFLGQDDREIVGWDTTARNHGTAMRLLLAPIAPPTTIAPPITTSPPITTAPPVTTTPATSAADADSDGYDTNSDCNDTEASIHPGATELVGDGVDQDCDAKELCYADADGDGYGGSDTVTSDDLDCTDPGEFTTSDDCLDVGEVSDVTAADVHPGATEACNEVDDDCNGTVDDGVTVPSWYQDGDGDGYGTGEAVEACGSPGEGWVDAGGDCADDDSAIHPDATDVPGNGVDEDCVGGDATGGDTDDGGGGGGTDDGDGDTEEPTDTGPDDGGHDGGKGCDGGGCATGGAPTPTGLAALASLVALVRRRRRG